MRYPDHHDKKSNNDGVEGKNISEALDALFKRVVISIKVPSPYSAHNNGH